jgi:hypothetical protein
MIKILEIKYKKKYYNYIKSQKYTVLKLIHNKLKLIHP